MLMTGGASAAPDHNPWYHGKYGRNRVVHLTLTATVGTVWLLSSVLKDQFSTGCRWCEPPGFDRSVRNALVWDNNGRAHMLSNINAYAVGPALGLGLLILSDHDASPSRLIDDLLPIIETTVFCQLFTSVAKLAVARKRPYVYFDTPGIPSSNNDNLSFWSGHSSFGFAITTSAGLIAHWRGYWTEPYIWGLGITASLTTEYLRIAGDRHYLSDVLVGGLVGVGAGLLVPRLMRRDLKLVPVANGAAVVGRF
ncbi:MAG: phosphatase PAP2 family protein [Kofleriaceae bacterium]